MARGNSPWIITRTAEKAAAPGEARQTKPRVRFNCRTDFIFCRVVSCFAMVFLYIIEDNMAINCPYLFKLTCKKSIDRMV
jgi:hypothetical protein